MRAFVSIDWDYFVRSLYAWDWGHQESPFFMEGGMWEIRASGLLMQGLDLRPEMDPTKWATPKPWNFWDILSQLGYNWLMLDEAEGHTDHANFVVADSHAVAGPAFRGAAEDLGPPDIIINFDAHHDMGYGSKAQVNRMVSSGQVSCDMWLRSLMSMYANMRTNVVFPDWRFAEFSIESEWQALKKVLPAGIAKRTRIGSFTDESGAVSSVVKPARQIDVEALFICRSSAWTPPWLDQQFIDFVEGVGEHTGVSPYEYASENIPTIEPMTPRKSFSWERVEAMASQMKALMAQPRPK